MLQVKEIALSELKMYENNPRNNDQAVDQVAESIREFGFKVPMVVDKDNVIVCGHTRYKACLKLGIETVPCVIADDLTPDQIKAFRLADNKTGELATWDWDMLQEELKEIENIDMTGFGFELPELEAEEVEEDDYDLAAALENPPPRGAWGCIPVRPAPTHVRRLHKPGGHHEADG